MSTSRNVYKKKTAMPSRIAPEKVYNYIKKLEVDGLPRVRAYAEAIDPAIYDLTPSQISDKLDYLKSHYKGYDEIRESVLAEQAEWNLRRSAALQGKAMDLLSNLLDKANDIAKNPEADPKELNAAINTLKSIMPALTTANQPVSEPSTNRKARAARYIN